MVTKKYKDEFIFLENLRQSGITNMYGAAPYLAKAFGISLVSSRKILIIWMDNYSELKSSGRI